MTMTDSERLTAASRLVKIATGDEWGDGDVVTDMGIGYAPGNGSWNSDVWVTGNWNEKTRYENGERVVIDSMPKRLAEALERLNVSIEWLDENYPCSSCSKLVRTEPDCYTWTPQYVANDDGITCLSCVKDSPEEFIDEYVNEVTKAITWLSESELSEYGWHDAFPSDADAQSGWYGREDKPADMVKRLPDDAGDWVFIITDVNQFHTNFRLFVRDEDA